MSSSLPIPRAGEDAPAVRAVVVIPCFNNARTVAAVAVAARTACDLPVIVIDDGSTDGFADAAAPLESNDGISLIRHEKNLGKAAALRTGFAAAERLAATHAVTIDADGQHDPTDLPRLLERARRSPAALVVGRRPSRMEGRPGRCAAGLWLSNLLVRCNGGPRLLDSQSGLRVYPLDLVRDASLRAERFGLETEVIVRAARSGRTIVEEPITCRYLPEGQRVSHYRPWVDTLRHAALHARLAAEGIGQRDGQQRRGWRRALALLQDEAGSGRSVSASLALGVFVGCSPLYGLHAPICLALGWKTRLKTLPLLLGSQISTPPLGAFFAIASIGVGHLVLTGREPGRLEIPATPAEVASLSLDLMLSWLLGWVLLGGLLALAVYGIPRLGIGLRRPRPWRSGEGDDSGCKAEQIIDTHRLQAATGD